MKHYYADPIKSAREDVIRELARARYYMMLQNPATRVKVLRIARDILTEQITEHENFYHNNLDEYENQSMTSDDLKLLFLHDSFESVEALMCDFYYPSTYSMTLHEPRIFSIEP